MVYIYVGFPKGNYPKTFLIIFDSQTFIKLKDLLH